MRKFSLTSSQAHNAFKVSFEHFRNEPHWQVAARYLYGDDYERILVANDNSTSASPDDIAVSAEEDTSSVAGDDDNVVPPPALGTDENDAQHEDSVENDAPPVPIDQDRPPDEDLDLKNFLKRKYEEEVLVQRTDDLNFVCVIHFLIHMVCPDYIDEGYEPPFSPKIAPLIIDAPDKSYRYVENQADAEKVLKDRVRTGAFRGAIWDLLLSPVPDVYTNRNRPNKTLVNWLQSSNKRREFMLYNAAGLKNLLKDRNLKFASGKSTSERILNVLSGEGDEETVPISQNTSSDNGDASATTPLSIRDETLKEILKKSFLPPQKGTKREYCSLGHRLEKPILKSCIKMFSSPESSVPGIEICGAYTAGLAARKGANYAKDSIDFIVVVDDPLCHPSVDDEDDDNYSPLKAWGFECKGRVTARTAAAEEEEFPSYINPHQRINASDVHVHVKDVGERFQVIQHAFVYDLDAVVLAISDNQADLIRSSVIDFSKDLRIDFGKVLKDIKDFTLAWAYPPEFDTSRPQVIPVPDEVLKVAAGIPTINGDETLQGTFNVWLALSRLSQPFPSFHRLIPAICAYWNAVKGGSDTTTLLMDNNTVRIPHAWVNCETVAVTRLTLLLFVMAHRLFQTVSVKSDIDVYRTLHRYRDSANHRYSFHKSIMQIHSQMRSKLSSVINPQEQRYIQTPPRRRQMPNRRRHLGLLTENVNFGARLESATPSKITRSVQQGTASEDVVSMVENCTGMPMKIRGEKGKDMRQKCDLCKANGLDNKTSWYCVGCKRWLCMERKQVKKEDTTLTMYSNTRTKNGKQVTEHFMKCCFHNAHQGMWCQLTNPDDEDN